MIKYHHKHGHRCQIFSKPYIDLIPVCALGAVMPLDKWVSNVDSASRALPYAMNALEQDPFGLAERDSTLTQHMHIYSWTLFFLLDILFS